MSSPVRDEVGLFVEVCDPSWDPPGGVNIFTWSQTEGIHSIRTWVKTLDEADRHVEASGWTIEWFDEPPSEARASQPRG